MRRMVGSIIIKFLCKISKLGFPEYCFAALIFFSFFLIKNKQKILKQRQLTFQASQLNEQEAYQSSPPTTHHHHQSKLHL